MSVLLWGQSSFKSQRNAWAFTYTLFFFWKMNFFHTIYSYHSFPFLISFQILPTFLLIQLHTFSLFRKRTGKLKTKTNQNGSKKTEKQQEKHTHIIKTQNQSHNIQTKVVRLKKKKSPNTVLWDKKKNLQENNGVHLVMDISCWAF